MKQEFVKDRGLILYVTMVLLFLITALVLSMVQGIFLLSKTHNQLMNQHTVLHSMEAVAKILSSMLAPECITDREPDWKKEKGCTIQLKRKTFYYYISELGEEPCLQILELQKILGSQHWLISIVAIEEKIQLQIRIALPHHTHQCTQSSRRIKQGIISWNFMPL